jgi:hypothetical protein
MHAGRGGQVAPFGNVNMYFERIMRALLCAHAELLPDSGTMVDNPQEWAYV